MSEEASRSHNAARSSRWFRAGAALLVLAAGVVCGLAIDGQAVDGEYRFGASGVVLMIWVAGLGAAIGTWFIAREPTVGRAVGVLVLVVAITAFTVWQIRPQAPVGDGYPENLASGNASLEAEVSSALDATISGRWRVRFVDSPYPCRDWLGRTRGAAQITSSFEIHPHLTIAELHSIGEELQGRGWTVIFIDHDFGDQQGERLTATRDGYSVDVDATFDELTVYKDGRVGDDENTVSATTPCLRRE